MKQEFDIGIVGDGIVGLTFALAIAQETPLKVAVFSAADPIKWQEDDYAPRVSAITPASKKIYQHLQVWPKILAARISPFHAIHAWDKNKRNEILFEAAEIGELNLGYIVENNLIQTKLHEALSECMNVSFIKTKLTQCNHYEKHVELIDDAMHVYRVKLIVGADGANSWLRRHLEIKTSRYDYQQSAIVCHVQTEKPHEFVARQIFLPGGPLAFLPLANENECSIVWSEAVDESLHHMSLSDDEFKIALQAAFKNTLGEIKKVSKRYQFPLIAQQADHYILANVVLIGDAAHVVHPLAGQGVNLGIADAICLADVVKKAQQKRRDFAAHYTLRQYERARRAENQMMMMGIDAIKKIFATENSAIEWLRNIGLKATNRNATLKKFFINYAVGRDR